MIAILGILLVLASILIFAWAIVAFRRPDGPVWRERYLVLESLACAIVGIFVFGMAMQFRFALEFEGPVSWVLCAAVLAFPPFAYRLIWRRLHIDATLASFEAAEGAAKPANIAQPPIAANRSRAA